MRTLTDPILHDCARIIERHPDLSPDYKIRLLNGLDTIDRTMHEPPLVFDGETAKDYGDRRTEELALKPKGAKR